MHQREGQLRAVTLIFIVVAATLIIGSVLFYASTALGILGVLGTLLFGLFGVYTHYFELPDGVRDSVHEVELDESATVGRRPESTATGFDISREDVVLSQLPPKRVAQVISNTPGWHPGGHGGYSTWWRPRLRRLFHSDVFSTKTFELSLLGFTMGSLVLLYFIFLSFLPAEFLMSVLEPLTGVYPSNQPIEQTQLLGGVCLCFAILGTAYFEIKHASTCPVCGSPFALDSKQRYFRPEHREVLTRTRDGETVELEVTYGVHIFHCESCGAWSVFHDDWERRLNSQ